MASTKFTSLLACVSVAASLAVAGGAASAATYTFDFNDKNNQVDVGSGPAKRNTYQENGYIFDPFNGNTSSNCYDTGNGLGCFLETNNGETTELSNLNDSSATFDGISFFFDMQGNQGNNGGPLNNFDVFDNDGDIFNFTVGNTYDGTNGVTVYDATSFVVAGPITAASGYFAIFDDNFTINTGTNSGQLGSFDGITSWSWNGSESAQSRIDCVSISEDGSNMTVGALSGCEPDAGDGGVTPPPNVVPLPAGLSLILTGLGALAAFRLRKRKTA